MRRRALPSAFLLLLLPRLEHRHGIRVDPVGDERRFGHCHTTKAGRGAGWIIIGGEVASNATGSTQRRFQILVNGTLIPGGVPYGRPWAGRRPLGDLVGARDPLRVELPFDPAYALDLDRRFPPRQLGPLHWPGNWEERKENLEAIETMAAEHAEAMEVSL